MVQGGNGFGDEKCAVALSITKRAVELQRHQLLETSGRKVFTSGQFRAVQILVWWLNTMP